MYSNTLVTINNEYEYEYDKVVRDGSLLLYIIRNYGIEELKKVLNYHKITNEKNLT